MARMAMAIMGIGILALGVGLFMPALIDAQDAEVRDTLNLKEGDSAVVDEVVEIEMVEVDNANSFVNLTVIDVGTQASANVTNLSVGETKSVTPADEPIEVTLEEIEGGNEAKVTPSFSRTYGWNDGAATFLTELDTILALLGFLMILGGIGAIFT